MAGSSKTDSSKKPADVSKKTPGDNKKTPPADGQISNADLDKVSGGLASVGGYGTVDYGTRTSHGGD